MNTTAPLVIAPRAQPLTLPEDERQRVNAALRRLDRIAKLMDDQFELPLVKRRIGLDPIIGLIPGGGDWAVWFVSVYIFWEALRLGATKPLLIKMGVNIAVDLLGGYVPGVGDVFDAMFKANLRNVALIRAHFGGPTQPGAPLPAVIPQAALEARRVRPVTRYALAALIISALLALASGPFVLLYLLLRSFA